ncbi:extradiol dioxygenase [Pullulanibacillus camelliae]|uniref:Extradiol dioxygenase n=1 Tax=Pullulanibacillus camelliae TaxID=1707096 RepID=A0A8J2YGH2_9BACL|nr:extradiol ring-cleavage dioxygenase [Pullulanibacillus camelliae]GGE39063.1 extradiol dioxygenase [Pullulanibacillus camelliae]
MGQIVYSCITPHGGEIILELAGQHVERMQTTRRSMETLGKRMREQRPDALVVITPHGIRSDGQFSIINSESVVGSEQENNRTYTMRREVERPLAQSIAKEAQESGLPVSLLNFGTTEGPLSVLPLDWGAVVPLAFMPDLPVVIITPSRLNSNQEMLLFGEILRKSIEQSDKSVGIIASCDWCHTHDEAGPYGYHPSAKIVDERIVSIIKSGALEECGNISQEDIESAKPDGIWQTLILAGAVPQNDRSIEWLSYEVPTYFGLICAEVSRN